jgi:hypothetical protein
MYVSTYNFLIEHKLVALQEVPNANRRRRWALLRTHSDTLSNTLSVYPFLPLVL